MFEMLRFQHLFINFAPEIGSNDSAKVTKMFELSVISALIIAIGVAFLCVKVIFRKNGSFTSQHIHDSEAMRERGIHCVLDQDREMRRRSSLAVDEKIKDR